MQADTARKRFGSYFEIDHWSDTASVTEHLGKLTNPEYQFLNEQDAIDAAAENHTERLTTTVVHNDLLASNSKILLFRYNNGWLPETKMKRIKEILEENAAAKNALARFKDVAKIDVEYVKDEMKIAADMHVGDDLYILQYNHFITEGIRVEVQQVEDVSIYDNRNTTSSNPREDEYDFNVQYSTGNYGFDLMDTKDDLEAGEIDVSHFESKAFRTMEDLAVFRAKLVKQIKSQLASE